MATSLAQQLKKLQAPQTSLLKDSLHRASLLFDPKEAANKDRETIFEIGLSGLEELIQLDANFSEFEETLFDQSSRDFQRVIETSEVNVRLNKTIGKFLHRLSPYFLLQSAHKCLEWLIRRYHIHTFNKEMFIGLILPYHETRMFVRCVQLLELSDERDPWHWLHKIQKPGVPLPKRTIFNHASTRPSFLKFVGQTVIDAVHTLKNRARTLQALFSFYCTTTIGALYNLNELNENHIINILPALLKGLKSEVVDFAAATYMITAQLLVKGTFNAKFLDSILRKLLVCQHTSLQIDAIMLCVLMFNHHIEMIDVISVETLALIVENPRFTTVLGQVAKEKLNVIPFYGKLVNGCLRMVQTRTDRWMDAKKLLETSIGELNLSDTDAEIIIEVVINSYIVYETKTKPSNDRMYVDGDNENDGQIIEIDSDDEMVGEHTEAANCLKWYSEYLKRFESQFPGPFDRVIKRIMKGEKSGISATEKQALKSVLGVLLQITYTEDNTNIFENLYHHNSMQRVRAVKYIADNFTKLNISADCRDLFCESIIERLRDDNPEVVVEVLRMRSTDLVNVLGNVEVVITNIYTLLLKSFANFSKWESVVEEIISRKLNDTTLFEENRNYDDLIVYIFPLCFPVTSRDRHLLKLLLNTRFGKRNSFLKFFSKQLDESDTDVTIIRKTVHSILENRSENFGDFERVVTNIRSIFEHHLNPVSFFYGTLFLAYAMPRVLVSGAQSSALIDLVFTTSARLKFSPVPNQELIEAHTNVRENVLPVGILIKFLTSMIEGTNFKWISSNVDILATDNENVEHAQTLGLVVHLFDVILERLFDAKKSADRDLFRELLSKFLANLFTTADDKFEFLCNLFASASGNVMKSTLSPIFQIRVLQLLIALVQSSTTSKQLQEIRFNSLLHLLVGLNSRYSVIRESTLKLLTAIEEAGIGTEFLRQILERKEEISYDHEQIPLILFTVLTGTKKKTHRAILSQFVNKIFEEATSEYMINQLLELIKHINNREILSKLCQLGDRLLSQNHDSKPHTVFSVTKSEIFRKIFYRFDPSTVEALEDIHVSAFVRRSLTTYSVQLQIDNKLKAPGTLLLEVLTVECFEQIKKDDQRKMLICAMIEAATFADDDNLISAAKKLFTRTEMDASLIEQILVEMKKVTTVNESMVNTAPGGRRVRKSMLSKPTDFITPIAMLTTNEWRMGITLLEFLQNKSNIGNGHQLIVTFFDVLKLCLNFEEQSPVEYTKQLLLSCILAACQNSTNFANNKVFCIEDIVQCVRGTQNPQTHHHALLLLCHTASMIPDQVLQHMMDIFTFMGSSVVRHDDAYSFQIIIKIIEMVIPILIHAGDDQLTSTERNNYTIPVLKIFSDIVLDVPEHRRIPLYTKLMRTLGAGTYLWMFLGVLFENHVVRQEKEKKLAAAVASKKGAGVHPHHTKGEEQITRRIEIALTITQEFEVPIILETCTHFLEYLRTLPDTIPEKSSTSMASNKSDCEIFPLIGHIPKQLRHFKYTIVQFIGTLTASPAFVNRIAALDDVATHQLKTFYQNLIIKILMYIPEVSKSAEQCEQSQKKYMKVILYHCYDILDNAVSLLSVETFLLVVHGLVQHKILSVRKRVIELFVTKIQHNTEFVEKCDREQLLQILVQLRRIIDMPSKDDIIEIQQISLIAIKLLSKILCAEHPDHFKEILIELTEFLASDSVSVNKNLRATVVLCLGEVCVNLKAHALSHLSKFMPLLIGIMGSQIGTTINNPLLIATIISVQKIIDTIPLFLSPYLTRIIIILAEASASIHTNDDKLNTRLNQTFEKIASSVPGRILIPAIETVHQKLIMKMNYRALTPVMKIISEAFDHIPADEMRMLQMELSNFFMSALEFRTQNTSTYDVTPIESDVIKAFVRLVLKLSESSFRPIYMKIYDWALRSTDPDCKERAITFYNLSAHIAESLKSMITLFAGFFIQNAAELLDACNSVKADGDNQPMYFPDSEKNTILLIEHIVRTLYLVFLNDSQNFVNAHRFAYLMQPIVDQIENELILDNETVMNLMSMCISQLAVAINDDSLWKQLNYQVLLKTRTNNPKIRLFALRVCLEIAKKLGENYLPFLPETIPFLAELLEDENPEVERSCQKAVQEMEKVIGEPLQKYF